ncbi:hypothetical protein [Nocardioides sp. CFH 31398]|uniref:hypothetical protein n=1 Tax=Nocardioides sp. CFH 31398 TaxID=2919579 RepID=UPI001F05FA7A|nr:hypothetical protein [Nocardioides sp. CFH 31398]MCH1865295.1 hypothetical protein [Nocardioides sp. CFH 31398]
MPQTKFDSALVQGVCQFIDDTGIVEQVAAWRREDRIDRKPGGRPAFYDDRQMLVLTQLLLRCGEAPQIVEIARTIGYRLTADSRERLGLPPTNGRASEVAIYHRVRNALDRCTSVFDPAPGRASSPRPARTRVEQIKAARDPEQCERSRLRAHWVANQLLEGTLALVPDAVLGRWTGNLTLDATVVPIFGGGSPTKNPKPDDSMSPEFDGGYHPNHDGSKTWGYDLHIAMMGQNHYDRPADFPLLAAAISLDEPSRRVAENAIACLSSIRDRGHPAALLITDMGYFANQKAEKFHLPARALGYGLVGDYKKGFTGIQATHKGVITVDGGRYCPSMPAPLVTATADFREGRISEEVYAKRIAQRVAHRFRAKDGVAHVCPAQGSSPTASCSLRPRPDPLTSAENRTTLTLIVDPPEDPPPCCTNRSSVSLPIEYDAKFFQALPYASEEWRRTYRLLRSTMEGFNGYTKEGKHEALAAKTNRRRRGFVNNLLVVAMTVAATNLRKIASFFKAQTPPPEDNPAPKRRGRRDPLAIHRPDPHAPPRTMPGAAAA